MVNLSSCMTQATGRWDMKCNGPRNVLRARKTYRDEFASAAGAASSIYARLASHGDTNWTEERLEITTQRVAPRYRGLENTEREFLRETDDETPIVNSTNYHPRVSASVLRNRRMHCDKNFLSSSRFYIHREVLRLHDNNALSATFERRI